METFESTYLTIDGECGPKELEFMLGCLKSCAITHINVQQWPLDEETSMRLETAICENAEFLQEFQWNDPMPPSPEFADELAALPCLKTFALTAVECPLSDIDSVLQTAFENPSIDWVYLSGEQILMDSNNVCELLRYITHSMQLTFHDMQLSTDEVFELIDMSTLLQKGVSLELMFLRVQFVPGHAECDEIANLCKINKTMMIGGAGNEFKELPELEECLFGLDTGPRSEEVVF